MPKSFVPVAETNDYDAELWLSGEPLTVLAVNSVLAMAVPGMPLGWLITSSSRPTVETRVPACPEVLTHKVPLPLAVDASQMNRAFSFDIANYLRHRILARDRNQHMHVVPHQVSLLDPALFVRGKLAEHFPQIFRSSWRTASVTGNFGASKTTWYLATSPAALRCEQSQLGHGNSSSRTRMTGAVFLPNARQKTYAIRGARGRVDFACLVRNAGDAERIYAVSELRAIYDRVEHHARARGPGLAKEASASPGRPAGTCSAEND